MVKKHTVYICQECGAQSIRFGGRCHECGAWNSLVESVVPQERQAKSVLRSTGTGIAVAQRLKEIRSGEESRLTSGMAEADRVLGGGFVSGSLILIGGEPGIGKSTLLLQIAANVGTPDSPALYVSAEESPQQIKMRADRLGIDDASVMILAETDVDRIVALSRESLPSLVVVDSIQTIATDSLASVPGAIGQVRECTMLLMRLAKESHVPVIIIGHVTKDGVVAGPRALEHIVDVVLYLEGERFHAYRLLRSVKNRFGATEVGIFEMQSQGLVEVLDPSGIFLGSRHPGIAGSVVVGSVEGTRPLLVEVQALTVPSAYGTPARTANGIDHSRLLMVLAVLTRRAGLRLGQHDVYVNVAGGLDLREPAADIGVAVAIASSVQDIRVAPDLVFIGEVGLGGELRTVTRLENRLREVERLGFKRCIIPYDGVQRQLVDSTLTVIPVRSIAEAIAIALVKGSE